VTRRSQDGYRRPERLATDKVGPMRLGSTPEDLIERIEKLRTLLPAFAQETATARREVVRLRSQNAKLQRRVAELETRFDVGCGPRSRDA
jgi:hypothetical protein